MTDVEFMLKEDIKEKKSTGRGARYKRDGSKSKKCNLPSDHLSKKEFKKMNGECIMYNLSKPMSYAEFKKMPKDLQIEYLTKLRDTYNAEQKHIAEMMGVSGRVLSDHRRHNLNSEPYFSKAHNKKLKAYEWNKFLGSEIDEDVPVEDTLNDTEEVEENKSIDICEKPEIPMFDINAKPDITVFNGSVTFRGTPADIFNKMIAILDENDTYDITIDFTKTTSA